MQDEAAQSGFFAALLDGLIWLVSNIAMAFVNFGQAVLNPSLWLDWTNKEAVMRFVYYGGSVEFFFVVFTAFLILTAIGIWKHNVMWGAVRVMEGFANTVGRFFAWAGLLMVLQQIIIVFMQRIFTRPDISFGFGIPLQFDISWFAEELKLYNALVVALCASYTFVQGGHVRVDLVYSAVSFRTKKIIDMVGALLFMLPVAVLTWMYGWFFLWRHLIVPKPSASNTLERLLMKARAMRWNVETIGFSPNGFTG
jgi:TRAP-type mannitol/chloroaromatic compound transport system permease small subunit